MRPLTAALLALVTLTPAAASAFQVRPERPRLFLSNGSGPGTSLATFKERCSQDPAYMGRCQGALGAGDGTLPAAALAARYVVNGDPGGCGEAYTKLQSVAADTPGQPDGHSFISNNGRTMLQLAVVRDWCDGPLDAGQKQWIEDRMVSYADWYIANDGANDVFHDDMNNVWSAVALAGLSLAGTPSDAKAQEYLKAADDKWKKIILPALAYAGDWWHEGFVYVQPAIGSAVWYATAWTTATDDDIFAYGKAQAGDLWNGYIAFHAYATRPDYRYVYFGDTTDNKQSIELFSRYLIDMLTLGTGSPVGQAFSREIKEKSQPGYDYSGADAWMMALFYDASKDASATPRSALPTARWLGQGSNDVAILRSGWGPDDTFVWISCGDYLGAHQHYEAGSFQIFKKSPLTGATGYYDSFDTDHWQNYYSQHSVHANTLAIYQPGEFFPTIQSLNDPSKNVNDGGQRVLRRDEKGTGYPSPDLPTYLAQKTAPPFKETGDIKTFETAECHDYVACDVTAAYTSPGRTTNGNSAKVNEVTRQFVFLRPDLLVVFDRVEATDAAYDKRFLLHALAAPEVSGNQITITNGEGRLFAQTLLPASADMTTVTNFEVDGVPHPPSSSGNESGGSRVEVSPSKEEARDYFLHLFDATDSSQGAPPSASATEEGDQVKVTIDHAGAHYEITFAKSGDLGGHLTKSEGGSTVCDQDLGQFASGTGGSGSGATGAGGGGGGSGGEGGSDTSGDEGGCGCEAVGRSGEGGLAAIAALSLATARILRARRRASTRSPAPRPRSSR
jgi:hypothetical protein